MILLLCWR
uniref:Uncharacterized protein n=1 Tax=Arundo donax TaxID=35708 RepID=A0A0A9HTI9_ARUDO